MGTIYATDRDGTKHELEGRERASFMEILKMGGLSVEALCSGCCQCATCHVFIDEDWMDKLPEQTEFELATLESEVEQEGMRPNSRLSCQIQWSDELDGIRLTVAPEF
jgi:2Fe-2S ferredoxin